MKKKLEADLISIAHRILRLKGKEDVELLWLEAQKVYEKLTVLRFIEQNSTLPDVYSPEQLDEFFLDDAPTPKPEPVVVEQEPVVIFNEPEPVVVEPVITSEPVAPEPEAVITQPVVETPAELTTSKQITLEDLLSPEFREPDFIKKDSPKVSLNDRLNQTITLGLNDRIAFEKHLFLGKTADLNRVISQLNTFDNIDEAKNFITHLVKPDFNYWLGKEEYETRFMELIEKRFSV